MLALSLLLVAIILDWHSTHPDEVVGEAIQLAQRSEMEVPYAIKRLARIMPYLNLWVTLGSAVLVLVIWRRWNEPRKLLVPLVISSVSFAA